MLDRYVCVALWVGWNSDLSANGGVVGDRLKTTMHRPVSCSCPSGGRVGDLFGKLNLTARRVSMSVIRVKWQRNDLRRRDGRGRSKVLSADFGWRTIAATWADTVSNLLESSEGWRRSVLDRIAVLAAAPGATFLRLLFQLLLSLGIGETKVKLDSVMLDNECMKLSNDSFGNVATFEPREISECWKRGTADSPSKANFFANSRWRISANLRGDSSIRMKMFGKVL